MGTIVFQARYDGWCNACGDMIEAGDEVTYNSDDILVHDECDDPVDPDDVFA